MSAAQNACIAYFMKITHCDKDIAIRYFTEADEKLDLALNTFFEKESHSNDNKSNIRVVERNLSTPIIIPTMIEFQRFIESFENHSKTLLENSTKMMNLAMKYATCKQPNLPSNQIEHWKIHLKVDFTRLQTLLDNDMCAPLVWIEHFEHLLNGKICQLFDCDYMFNIIDYTTKTTD